MRYWITTHWPAREGDVRPIGNGIYLPHDRRNVGRELRPGDLVLVYQAQTGRTLIRTDADGTTRRIPCLPGKGGIVAIGRALSAMYHDDAAEVEHYTDGTAIHWAWHAPLEVLSTSGFVSRFDLNRILGYQPSYSFRGFGDQKSGVKEIDEATYLTIEHAFRSSRPPTLPVLPTEPRTGGPPGGEQPPHLRLKQYVAYAPVEALGERGLVLTKMEHPFPTGDRADVVLADRFGRAIAVEVEVDVGDKQAEGLLQALKYAVMLEPLYGRERGDSRAMLVAYAVTKPMRAVCAKYGVECIVVAREGVDAWHAAHPGLHHTSVLTEAVCEPV